MDECEKLVKSKKNIISAAFAPILLQHRCSLLLHYADYHLLHAVAAGAGPTFGHEVGLSAAFGGESGGDLECPDTMARM